VGLGDLSAAKTATAGRWTLLAAIVGSGMGFIDGTAVNVALPIVQRDLNATSAQLQWVVEGYSLFLSALILIGGSLGDLFGRRRVFALGIVLFAAASLACALSSRIEFLIAARAVQGIGGALATPGSLALISASFRGPERGRAIGTWSGFSSITAAAGPLLGGWLTQVGSWRWVFLINLPLSLVALYALAHVTESRDDGADRRVDVGGASLATFGLGALVYGLIGLQAGTLDPWSLGLAVLGLATLVAFCFFEARVRDPMLQLALFRSRVFSVANAYTVLLYAALGGSLYFIPFDLIDVQGYSPAQAGAALLPFILIMFALSRFSGGLVARLGPRRPLVLGAVLAALGFVAFALAGVGRSYWVSFFPAAVLLGLGGAAFVAPLTTTVMDSAPTEHSGVASGINNALSRASGLIAIAALGIALAGGFDRAFAGAFGHGPAISNATRAILVRERAQIVAGQVPRDVEPRDRAVVAAAIRQAFSAGFRTAMLAGAGLALCAGLLALFALPTAGRAQAVPSA
jgi:EmrB/QacA subfamily drug resistance transporter